MKIYQWINTHSALVLTLFLSTLCSCKSSEETPKAIANQETETPKPVRDPSSHDRAIDDPDLSTFKQALIAGGLQDIFIGTGPFTVFAPTNQAFAKLGKDKVKTLFKPENKDQLVSILIFHVVPGKYMSNMLKTRSYRTINGKNIEITVENGEVKVNNAKVIKSDLVGPNGVFHHIDTVLMP